MVALDLGLIFSTSGSYATLGRDALAGAMMAIDDLRTDGRADVTPVARDPGGDPARYERDTADLLDSGVRHIIGAITSWSRKDMIPVLERLGGLLWYPCPSEGFKSNDHVVYLGTAPNHHMVPLADWIADQRMRRAYLVGSNYVWGWETLRLARECLLARGVEVVGERYLPLGVTETGHIVDEIAGQAVDVVIDSLIGPSNMAFLRDLARRDPTRVGRPGHVVSCNQTEADLSDLGAAADGLVTAGSFFEADASEAFRKRAFRWAPNGRISSFFATSYAAVEIAVAATRRAGTAIPRAVFSAAAAGPVETVLGPVDVDPVTRYAALRPRLAIAEGGRFRVLDRSPVPVPADPYLTAPPAVFARSGQKPDLRLVT